MRIFESHDQNAVLSLFRLPGAAAAQFGRVWEGFAKVLVDLQELERFGRVWEVWRVGGRVGTVYEDLGWFGKVWEDLRSLGDFG